jgi:hypothetical protein
MFCSLGRVLATMPLAPSFQPPSDCVERVLSGLRWRVTGVVWGLLVGLWWRCGNDGFGMHADLDAMALPAPVDPLGFAALEEDGGDVGAVGLLSFGAVDDRFAAVKLCEHVGRHPEFVDASDAAAAGESGPVPVGLVGVLPQLAGSHHPGEPVTAIGRCLAVRDDRREVV